jgi:cation transport ATPase
LDTSFHERYAGLSDQELLHIAGDRKDLLEEAAVALDAEMARRDLTHKQARAKKRDKLRAHIKEARTHHPKRNKSKYFVAQMNLRAYFIGLVGLVLLMFFTLGHRHVSEEWSWPLFVVYVGVLIACLVVQPWVRRTLSFWLSLAVSCVPQFVVAHWLTVHYPAHSNSEAKGLAFLSMFAGYFLGVPLFVLMQKFRPEQGTKTTQ